MAKQPKSQSFAEDARGSGGGSGVRNRIREYKSIRCADLVANPQNWRAHGETQKAAMAGILQEVGLVDALLVRDRGDGTYDIVDGHMRAGMLPHDELPCLVLDITEAEATKVLLTFDPIAAMAETNAANLDALLREVEFSDAALQQLVTDLADNAGMYTDELAAAEGNEQDSPYTTKITAPIYEPKGEQPPLTALVDRTKADELIDEINVSDLPDAVKRFLRDAAERHVVFHFRNIAEYYCHASPALQDLMEKSGLIIIDFDKAIQNGFVHMTDKLGQLADLELSERDDAS